MNNLPSSQTDSDSPRDRTAGAHAESIPTLPSESIDAVDSGDATPVFPPGTHDELDRAANSPAAPPADQPQHILACRRCGYDLRGSDASEVCPECGESILRGDDAKLLKYAAPRWLRRIKWGAAIHALGLFLPFPLILLNVIASSSQSLTLLNIERFVLSFSMLLLSAGAFLLSSREPDLMIEYSAGALRKLTRAVSFLAIPIPLLVWSIRRWLAVNLSASHFLFRWWLEPDVHFLVQVTMLAIAPILLAAGYCERIPLYVPSERARWAAKVTGWCVFWSVVLHLMTRDLAGIIDGGILTAMRVVLILLVLVTAYFFLRATHLMSVLARRLWKVRSL